MVCQVFDSPVLFCCDLIHMPVKEAPAFVACGIPLVSLHQPREPCRWLLSFRYIASDTHRCTQGKVALLHREVLPVRSSLQDRQVRLLHAKPTYLWYIPEWFDRIQ